MSQQAICISPVLNRAIKHNGGSQMRGNGKLKVVEEGTAKELSSGEFFNRLREIQAKQQFMGVAIPAMWDGDGIDTSTTIHGCQIIMHEITEDLIQVLKTLDPNFEN